MKYRQAISPTVPSSLSKRNDLIDVLAGAKEAPASAAASAKTPIEAAIQSAYLPPLRGENAELCRIGHEMEPIYGMNILEAAMNGIRLIDGSILVVKHLFRVGTVQQQNRRYQKDSADFLLIGTLNGRSIIAIVELKCRSKSSTQDAERKRLGFGRFASISCDSPDLRKYLLKRDEALQCAHHASTFGVNYVLFVTGDRISINGGVFD